MYEIFEELLKERGLTIAEFSRLSGIAKSTLYDWRSGKFRLKDDKRRIVADFFGVTLDYLDGRTTEREDPYLEKQIEWMEKRRAEKEALPDYVKNAMEVNRYIKEKPLYRVAAGNGCYNSQYADETVEADDGYEYATVVGDSMLPELRDGDTVKILRQTETTPHDYTLVKVDGEHATIKFVEIVENGVWLRALNKEVFEDKFFSIQEVMTLPITILGKVVSFERKL